MTAIIVFGLVFVSGGIMCWLMAETVMHEILAAVLNGFGFLMIAVAIALESLRRQLVYLVHHVSNIVGYASRSESHTSLTEQHTRKLADFFDGRKIEVNREAE